MNSFGEDETVKFKNDKSEVLDSYLDKGSK